MHLNYLALAVPVFTLLMLLEYACSAKEKFQFDESVANLNVGISERLCDLLCTGLFFFFYDWLHRNFAIFTIKENWLTWILLFLFTDFMWYWYHRFGHEVNLFWSVHVVHHQSEDYNFTVSARITIFQAVARALFWSVLPVAGFSAHMITTLLLIHGSYPFFTHTQLIGKLGWLEWIFVTPSHHRVHHSSNEIYLDKNYGDVLIIWDRIFGTFTKETEKPIYGLTSPLKSHSFLWQHFHFWLEMAVAFKRASTLKEKWLCIAGKPININAAIRPALERKFGIKKSKSPLTQSLKKHIRLQTIITLATLFLFILFEHYFTPLQLLIGGLFILLSVINTGAMLEQKKWIFYLEYTRLFLLTGFIQTYYPGKNVLLLLTIVLLIPTLYFKTLKNYYYKALY